MRDDLLLVPRVWGVSLDRRVSIAEGARRVLAERRGVRYQVEPPVQDPAWSDRADGTQRAGGVPDQALTRDLVCYFGPAPFEPLREKVLAGSISARVARMTGQGCHSVGQYLRWPYPPARGSHLNMPGSRV